MKAEELRIGNLVNYFGKEAVVTKVERCPGAFYIGAVSGNTTIWNVEDGFEGIPLTADRLLKLGFNKWPSSEQCYTISKGQLELIFFSTNTPLGKANGFPPNYFYFILNGVAVVFKYVHQVQNLWFTLTSI